MTTTLTTQAKHSATLTTQGKQPGHSLVPGTPIGLLLALTYAVFIGTVLTPQSRHSTTLTNQARH